MVSKHLWVYSQAIILLVLTLERQVVMEGEANTSGARREGRDVVRGSYLWAEQELVLWSHWGTLHVYRGDTVLPPPGPPQAWQHCHREEVVAVSLGLAATITGTYMPSSGAAW